MTMDPAAKAKIEAMKRQWDSRRRITEHLNRLKTKIGVYSGKGGVGKTSVAVNLAILLAMRGYRVGLLDADIDCPNVVKMMHSPAEPRYEDGKIQPADMHNVKVVSMGSFQEKEDEAIIWRGPMIHNAITQFLEATEWGDLDYLIVDLPPGTSDAPLTIMQTLKVDGFIVVTTPQELAMLDAKRSINMIKKLNVPVYGVVENMSGDIFGEGGGKQVATETNVKFLGSIKLDKAFVKPDVPVVLRHEKARREFEAIVDNLGLQVPTPSR